VRTRGILLGQRTSGILLGQRWYLQRTRDASTSDSVDLVIPKEIHGSLDVCQEFLDRHGYQPKDAIPPGAFEYVRQENER
jgi:hypothetical protein